jgi:hypothetical protein
VLPSASDYLWCLDFHLLPASVRLPRDASFPMLQFYPRTAAATLPLMSQVTAGA